MGQHREHFLLDDAAAMAHIEAEQPVTLIGVQKACQSAIQKKHLLYIVYTSQLRLVEPCCVGFGDQGQLLLRAYQREDNEGSLGQWKLFRGDKIEGMWEVNVPFEIRPDFRSGDQAMAVITAELKIDVQSAE